MADYFLSDLVEASTLVNTDLLHIRTIGSVDKKIQFLNLVKTFRDILNKNADYTIVDTDRNPIILVDSTSGNVTINLPTLAANQNKMIWIIKLVVANDVIVDGEGGETINGISSVTLSGAYEFIKLIGTSPTWVVDGILEIRTVDIKDQNVTSQKIKDRNATRIKIAEDAIGDFELDLGVGANQVDGDVVPLGTIISSSPTGGTATNLATTSFVRAAIQEAFNRLINLSGVQNGAAIARHLATDAVETAKIKALNVTTEKIAEENVTFPKMITGALDAYFKAQGAGVDPIYEKLALRDTGVKIGNNTRSTAGAQVITGVGFQSSVVLFFARDNSGIALNLSWGVDDGTTAWMMRIQDNGLQASVSGASLYILRDVSNSIRGVISALGSDGFTITWTLTGTCDCAYFYLCLP